VMMRAVSGGMTRKPKVTHGAGGHDPERDGDANHQVEQAVPQSGALPEDYRQVTSKETNRNSFRNTSSRSTTAPNTPAIRVRLGQWSPGCHL